tara:strand:+ start:18932 stop:20881 length:1950 start_codon:yes stop_codon:yes gene_type:complete
MIEEEIRITGNTEQAKKSFEELSAVILEQKKITIGFEDDLVRLERKLIAAGNAEWNPSRDLIKKKIIGVKNAISEQRVALKDLNLQRSIARKDQSDYTKGLTKTSGVVKVLNKLTGGLAGELLMLGRAATKGGKAMRVALISSGIGAAVALVGFLVAHWDAIAETLGLVNKELEIQKEANIENLRVVDAELSLLEKQIKYNDLRNISNTENLAKQKQLLIAKDALIKSNIKILELQLLKEKSTANELTTSQKLQVGALKLLGQSTQAAMLRAEFIATDLEERQRQNDLQEELNKLKGDELDIDLLLNPPQSKKDKDKEIKAKEKLLSDLDRLQQQAFEESLSKQEKEIQAVKNKYDKIIKAAKDADIETGLVEEGRRQAIEVINAKYRKIEADALEKQEQKKREILDRVGVEGLEAKIKAIEDKAEEDVKELGDLEIHRDAIEAIYQASEDRIAEIVKGASDKVIKEGKTKAAKEVKTAEEVADAKDEVLWNSIDNVDKSFKALAALDEENKALQAASLIASNLISAAKTIQSTIAANAQAKLLFPPTGQPFVTINTVAAGLGIAASAAATQKGLAALGKGGSTGGATGLDGLGGGPSAPEFNLVEGSESNAIQESIQSGSDPIKAVVISGDVTTAQQVDRNIVEGSGL